MLLNPRTLKSLYSTKKIQLRMIVATLNSNSSTTIISCYSPTKANDEKDLDTFYNKLSSLVRSIPKHNVLIIGGDINAKISKNENNTFSEHNSWNRNEELYLNTRFQKRKGKLWTYTLANNAKAQIDCIFINKIWINSAWDCKAYSFFEGVFSDHRILKAKIRLSLRAEQPKPPHNDWSLLNNRDICDKYSITQRNKFDALQEISETPCPNDEYENFDNAHLKAAAAAAEYIPTKLIAKHRVLWETLTVKKKRENGISM